MRLQKVLRYNSPSIRHPANEYNHRTLRNILHSRSTISILIFQIQNTSNIGPYMIPYMISYISPYKIIYMVPYMGPYISPYMIPYMALYMTPFLKYKILNIISDKNLYMGLYVDRYK